mmetsp:Transcript_12849/g.24324  ORF Transcript_12849/g.24324 Transcript_12849/m.24324 type:complete len:787 (-) Transcript_12849:194-2554(-)
MGLLSLVLLLIGHSQAITLDKETTIPRACVAPHDRYSFCDTKLSYEERAKDLVSRLALEEKPYLLTARESPKGNISRLGIPEYDWGGNCIHGVQSRCAPDGRCPTSFPNPNTLGSSLNTTVWRNMGAIIGLELRALWLQNVGENHESNLPHIGLDCWSPNINVVRDPRWGRNLETPSEDPYVCGKFGSEYSIGLQNGTDKRYLQAVTTLKHFTANSLEGPWYANGSYGGSLTRHTVDVNISEYDLQSTYLPAFKRSVQEGNAAGVMCSYNAVNGMPSCANTWLLEDQLRKGWGFQGYISSDSGAVVDMYNTHHTFPDLNRTVAAAIRAGCDVESAPWGKAGPWSTGSPYIDLLPNAVRSGLLTEAELDQAVTNTILIRMRLGLFDPIEDQPYWHVPPEVVHSDEHVAAAVDATQQGLVLLKNSAKTLPFDLTKGQKVAVVGPHANDRRQHLGNYLGQVCSTCEKETVSCFECVATPFEAIAKRNSNGETYNATGCKVTGDDTRGFEAALEIAGNADYVVFVGGLDVDNIEREGLDRDSVGLPEIQEKLLAKILAITDVKVALVLFHGGMVTLSSSLSSSLDAIVSAGYPGFYGSEALAASLFDTANELAVNRWGRTTVTWYSQKGWEDAAFNMVDFDMAKAPGRTYRYYTGSEEWAFGSGLSYTNFTVALMSHMKAGLFRVKVTNDGERVGDVVLLAYLAAKPGTIPSTEPAAKIQRELFSFERVGPLAPGKSAEVAFEMQLDEITQIDSQGKPVVYPGKYEVSVDVGSGSELKLEVECSSEGACE